MSEPFEDMLTGGHPNSLGRTIEVVETVLAHPARMEELFGCYESKDEVVRLRVSNAIRRVQAARPDLVLPFMDRLIEDIGALDQASAQWTLAKLFDVARPDMTPAQRAGAEAIMRRNVAEHGDWIVLNNTMETLTYWAEDDPILRDWLIPQLQRRTKDARKSVKARAVKFLKRLGA